MKYFLGKKYITPVSITKEILAGAKKEYGENSANALINCNTVSVKATADFDETKNKIDRFKKDKDTKIFINVARIAKQKNQQLLLDCMRSFEKENANVAALLIGDTTEENEILYKELISQKPSNTHFLGKVYNVGDYLLNADALVLTSFFEALPIALQEGFSAGLIPICTPVGGMLEIIDPSVGFLSKDISEPSFSEALKSFLQTDKQALLKMKENGKELFQKKLSMEVCAKKYEDLFMN